MRGTEMAEVIEVGQCVSTSGFAPSGYTVEIRSVNTYFQCRAQANEQIIEDVNRWLQSVASQQQ